MAQIAENVKERVSEGKEWLESRPRLAWWLTFWLFLNYVFDVVRQFG